MPDEPPRAAEAEQREQPGSAETVTPSAPTTGRRAAFQDIKRQLTDAELANPGTQKLLLDMLFTAEAERDEYKAYVPLYYAADKRASVAAEASKRSKLNESFFGIGLAFGGILIGLAPVLWTSGYGGIVLAIGILLILMAAGVRIAFR